MKLLPKSGYVCVFACALILTTFLGLVFTSPLFADSARRVIRVGAYDNPPKIRKDENGNIIGFWPDLIKIIADREDWRIEYVWGTWAQCLDRLEKNRIDMLPDTAYTKKRAQKYVFSTDPVLLSWSRVYVRSDNSGIKTILDLEGKTIAALAGSVNLEGPGGLRELAADFHLNCRFLEVDDYQQAMKAVKDGRADACSTNRNFGNRYGSRFGLSMTPIIFQPVTIKFAFPIHGRLTPWLVKTINARMAAFKKNQDSDYYRLLKKYFEGEIAQKKASFIPEWIWIVIKVICGLLLFTLLLLVCTTVMIRRKTREISERNAAVMDRELLYRLLFKNVPVGVFHYDKNLCITESNARFIAILQSSRDRIIGLDMKTLKDNNLLPALRKPLSGEEGVYEGAYMATTSNAKVLVHMRAAPVMDDQGRITGAVGIVEDISEKVRLEEQLRQSLKMEAVGTLAGGVAHDFNNLLTIIIGNADILLMNFEKDSHLHGQVDAIRKAGDRAASLTRQLLAFSRKQIIQPKVLNVNSVLKETEKMLRRLIGEDINMKCEYAQNLRSVLMDPGQIEQVVINLSVNARDAMPEGGDLVIETDNFELDEDYFRSRGVEGVAGAYVKISVTDNGAGMDADTCSRIFNPFFTTKGVGKGTGLGLSTVYGIIKQNRGYVWVYSEPGKGTTFEVYLPAHETDEGGIDVEVKESSGEEGLYGTECILLAEDEEMVRDLAVAILKKYGYTVLPAADGKAALRLASEHKGPIHLLLTDVVMPKMGGPLLAQTLLKTYPEIRVLFMSGYTDRAVYEQNIFAPADKLIEKPFTTKSLARKVREILDA